MSSGRTEPRRDSENATLPEPLLIKGQQMSTWFAWCACVCVRLRLRLDHVALCVHTTEVQDIWDHRLLLSTGERVSPNLSQ